MEKLEFRTDKVEDLNKSYEEELSKCSMQNRLKLSLSNSLSGTIVVSGKWGGWAVCNVSDIGVLIEELRYLKTVIEYETGVVL